MHEVIKSEVIQTKFFSCLGELNGSAFQVDDDRVAFETRMRWNPAGVFRRVISIQIDAIKLTAGRLLAFVGEKVLVGIISFADLDASGSVVSVAGVSRVITAAAHIKPCSIGRIRLHALPMFQSIRLLAKASAALSMAAAQVLRGGSDLVTTIRALAITVAKPKRISILWIGIRNTLSNGQVSESFTCKV